ncbi:membrane protein [Paractinoplanes deccanensis]|uniref:Membrane protein n=1 Tax=Paractinoplanes deccanensis TaxID=113561 RepID=A0ABQ3Y2Z7_9ACTN|nr:AEC family transporter [Actinoplanes deccanensis]GID74374.1 membrane protein [Actinoplanes deccanensis]
MISALSGLAAIALIVVAGWIAGRWGRLPADTVTVAGRLAYTVLSPCLLFTSASASDPSVLFSEPLVVSALAALLCFALHALVTRHRDRGTRIVGALAAGYTNAGYIGLPVAAYVLHDAALVLPVIMFQLLIITPVALTLFRIGSWRTSLTAPLRSPLTVAVILGVLVAVTGLRLPNVLLTPVSAIGQAAVPVVLLAFGMSLSGVRVLARGPDRLPTITAVLLKSFLMPAFALALALLLGLSPAETYAVTVLAALPAAQNVFLYAQSFSAGVTLARDAVFLSSVLCVPVLLAIALTGPMWS